MASGDFTYLARKTAFDKALRDKAFEIGSDPQYDGYQKGLASIVHKFFDKKSKGQKYKKWNWSEKRNSRNSWWTTQAHL